MPLDEYINQKALSEVAEHKQKAKETTIFLLVIINPKSGSGHARQQYRNEVEPLLLKKKFKLVAQVTCHAGHAVEIISKMNQIAIYSGIIGVGGDGLMSEIFHGLMQNPFITEKNRFVLGHIPCGSGNGLAKSQLFQAGKNYGIKEAAKLITKQKIRNLDTFDFSSAKPTNIRKGLSSVGFALIPDLDICSEPLRFLGGYPFIFGALKALWDKRAYHATLSYLPENISCSPIPELTSTLTPHFSHITGKFTYFMACITTHCSYNAYTAPGRKDGYFLITYVMNMSRWQMLKVLLGLENGTHVKEPFVNTIKTKCFRITPLCNDATITVDGEVVPCAPLQAKINEAAMPFFCGS